MSTSNEKWGISLLSAVIFYIIASPKLYSFTDKLFYDIFGINLITKKGKPTSLGVFIHALVFLLITRAFMEIDFNIKEGPLTVKTGTSFGTEEGVKF